MREATAPLISEFAEDVKRDLALTPKQLQSKYLYDQLGSSLFEAICRLPWYGITRAESRLLMRHAPEIVDEFCGGTIVELGCGSGEKIAMLAEALQTRGGSARVHLIDISPQALEQTEQRLTRLEHVSVVGHQSTYEEGLRKAAAARTSDDPVLVLLLGSNIGNFDTPAALGFLERIRRTLRAGDLLLLGADLVKPETDLIRAYDDPLGVTAAFNRNLLVRLNRELGGDFDIEAFDHRAMWHAEASRVEMHLVARRAQSIRVAKASLAFDMAAGEPIWTESSYKYCREGIVRHLDAAGFRMSSQWVDEADGFALTLAEAT
jgi:dimethylhistidine N-methyltransferase